MALYPALPGTRRADFEAAGPSAEAEAALRDRLNQDGWAAALKSNVVSFWATDAPPNDARVKVVVLKQALVSLAPEQTHQIDLWVSWPALQASTLATRHLGAAWEAEIPAEQLWPQLLRPLRASDLHDLWPILVLRWELLSVDTSGLANPTRLVVRTTFENQNQVVLPRDWVEGSVLASEGSDASAVAAAALGGGSQTVSSWFRSGWVLGGNRIVDYTTPAVLYAVEREGLVPSVAKRALLTINFDKVRDLMNSANYVTPEGEARYRVALGGRKRELPPTTLAWLTLHLTKRVELDELEKAKAAHTPPRTFADLHEEDAGRECDYFHVPRATLDRLITQVETETRQSQLCLSRKSGVRLALHGIGTRNYWQITPDVASRIKEAYVQPVVALRLTYVPVPKAFQDSSELV